MRNANVRDCAGIMRYFAFLEEELWKKDHNLTEWSGALVLEDLQKQNDHFRGLSFESISSIGPNGAVIHYAPSAKEASLLNNDEIYLLDSGR